MHITPICHLQSKPLKHYVGQPPHSGAYCSASPVRIRGLESLSVKHLDLSIPSSG